MKFFITTASGFEREAKNELKELVNCTVRHLFMRGTILLETEDKDFIKKIKKANTAYVSHVFPIQKEIEISKDKDSFNEIIDAVLEFNDIKKNETFAVRCERRGNHNFTSRDVSIAVASEIAGKVDLTNPKKVIVIQIMQSICFVSVVKSDDLIVKDIVNKRKYEQRPLNRAELKLREAIVEFGVTLEKNWRALDIGAAPGGWSRVLAEKVKEVVAVDPGELEINLPNITHIKKRIEDVKDFGEFDIIVNDMNLEPIESANIMCHLSRYLKDKGIVIMTIKFVTRDKSKHKKDAVAILSKCYKVKKVIKMPHNRYETTLLLVKK